MGILREIFDRDFFRRLIGGVAIFVGMPVAIATFIHFLPAIAAWVGG